MLNEEIRAAIKNNNAILGYRESVKFIKINQPKLVVISNNLPEQTKNEIQHIVKLSNGKAEIFEGSSKDLGTICGKPFPVSVLTIKG